MDLDGKSNYSLNANFRFLNFVLRTQKFKKEKLQFSQNLDLNLTYIIIFYRSCHTFSATILFLQEKLTTRSLAATDISLFRFLAMSAARFIARVDFHPW